MSAKNDITGDLIQSKVVTSQQFRDNFDAIFRKDNKSEQRPATDDALRVPVDVSKDTRENGAS